MTISCQTVIVLDQPSIPTEADNSAILILGVVGLGLLYIAKKK